MTRWLRVAAQDSLGGNAKTFVVACVNPGLRCYGETLSTLKFAARARRIKNRAVINEATDGDYRQLRAELERVRSELATYRVRCTRLLASVPAPALICGPRRWSACTTQSLFPTSLPTHATGKEGDGDNGQMMQLLAAAWQLRERAEEDAELLQARVDTLEELCRKKDEQVQSARMIVKFRESYIAQLERKTTVPPDLQQVARYRGRLPCVADAADMRADRRCTARKSSHCSDNWRAIRR